MAERLDGYLQRAHGDGYEAMAATEHGTELMEDRHEFAADLAAAALGRAHQGLRDFLNERAKLPNDTLSTVIDLITMSPMGLKGDDPTTERYRQRLTVLANAAATLVNGS